MRIVALGQALIHHRVEWPKALRALTRDADAVICNFEGCLPPNGTWPMKTRTVHAAHPDALAMLRDLGVTHLALANNHAWDYGHAGLVETRRRASEAGFAVTGAGENLATAAAPALHNGVALLSVDAGPTPDWAIAGKGPGVASVRLNRRLALPHADIARLRAITEITGEAARRRQRAEVGFDNKDEGGFYGLALTEAMQPAERWSVDVGDLGNLVAGIAAARATARSVLVALHYHHWSHDWSRPPDWLLPVARRIAQAGADAVLCTGPPFAYPVVSEGRAAIAQSLGNLVFHTRRSEVYDRLGLPVWAGQAVVFQDRQWHSEPVSTLRPPV